MKLFSSFCLFCHLPTRCFYSTSVTWSQRGPMLHFLLPHQLWLHRLLPQSDVYCHPRKLSVAGGPCWLSQQHTYLLNKMLIFCWEKNILWILTLWPLNFITRYLKFVWFYGALHTVGAKEELIELRSCPLHLGTRFTTQWLEKDAAHSLSRCQPSEGNAPWHSWHIA